jgi:hypothetical protein
MGVFPLVIEKEVAMNVVLADILFLGLGIAIEPAPNIAVILFSGTLVP